MVIAPGFIGIDVGKHDLEIFAGRGSRIANNPAAIADWLAQLEAPELVLFEATGRYDSALRQALRQAGIAFCRVNPAQARAFARAAGRLAKTDKVDAQVLALMAQTLDPPRQAPVDETRQLLGALARRRDQLVDMRRSELTRQQEAIEAESLADIAAHIDHLSSRIAAFDSRIAALVAASEELDQAQRLLRSLPGIGPVTATTLLAFLPEAGHRSPKTIAALAGLAPFNNDSGLFRGKRSIRGGRPRVRTALYMAALTACRSTGPLGDYFRRLANAGKPKKLALVALARKMLVIVNAILRDKIPFIP